MENWLFGVLQGLILLMAGVGIRGIFSIRNELRTLNGRLSILETRLTGHEALDNERFSHDRGTYGRHEWPRS